MADALLSRLEVRRRNRELMRVGLRLCRVHQGEPLPMTDAYFYRSATCVCGYEGICKRCKNARMVARSRERYASDPDYRAHRADLRRRDRARHLDARRAANARRQRAYRERKRTARHARVQAQVRAFLAWKAQRVERRYVEP